MDIALIIDGKVDCVWRKYRGPEPAAPKGGEWLIVPEGESVFGGDLYDGATWTRPAPPPSPPPREPSLAERLAAALKAKGVITDADLEAELAGAKR